MSAISARYQTVDFTSNKLNNRNTSILATQDGHFLPKSIV
ncbi:hypothetical protein AM1_6289 [Acaryochloris marina MBIC11017]|uniref:Uncharacterized protein n=1 Tax=Acaryochloris marina (strain MBIC 11017) TaxID=329726 RepID=B0C7D5_ACAM1|nr:hypothetical protein AM1_6289 [Acaryochloris marina MBIC11017]